MNDKQKIEDTLLFQPQFNEKGLIPCITVSAKTGNILMFAWMNQEALTRTLESRQMHYYSRSRGALWHKGANSGHTQSLIELRVDCDQDCLKAHVEVAGEEEIACHTGQASCFYRVVDKEGTLTLRSS